MLWARPDNLCGLPLQVAALIIAVISVIQSLTFTIMLSVTAMFIWNKLEAAEDGCADGDSDAMKWLKEMYGGVVVMALVEAFHLLFASILVYGIRQGERKYCEPWMMTEAAKDAIYMFVGILFLCYSRTWSSYLAEVSSFASAALGGTASPMDPLEKQTFCRVVGLLLLFYVAIFVFCLVVVIGYYRMMKNVKNSPAERDQRDPIMVE